jgi:FG-GAP-like repeat/FG-GAP repeat
VAWDGLLHPAGFYIVASSFDAAKTGVYRIGGSGAGRTLEAVPGSPFASIGGFPGSLALDRTGTLLFLTSSTTRNVTTFNVDRSTGALTILNTQPADTLGATGDIGGIAYVPMAHARDFDGDGEGDILWRNMTSGLTYIWFLDGLTIAGEGPVGAPTADWVVEQVGDVNGDGKADIVWRNSVSGLVYIWLLDGTTLIGQGPVLAPTADWVIQGVDDVNGDGKADILWRNISGQVYIWLMNGTDIVGAASLGTVGLDWAIQ